MSEINNKIEAELAFYKEQADLFTAAYVNTLKFMTSNVSEKLVDKLASDVNVELNAKNAIDLLMNSLDCNDTDCEFCTKAEVCGECDSPIVDSECNCVEETGCYQDCDECYPVVTDCHHHNLNVVCLDCGNNWS